MKLVIFDCDGTLVDSQDAICGAMSRAFQGLGLPAPHRADVLAVVGLSLPEAFQVLASRHSQAVRNDLAERYKSAFPATAAEGIARDPLYPGARTCIEALARRDDIRLGIATGKSRRGVARLFDQESIPTTPTVAPRRCISGARSRITSCAGMKSRWCRKTCAAMARCATS